MDRKDFTKASLLTHCVAWLTKAPVIDPFFSEPGNRQEDQDVIFYQKQDSPYERLRKGFNKRIDKFPAVIALCRNEQGIAKAIDRARSQKLPVAIKSGGHSMEGFSCNNGGLVIDLSPLDRMEWLNESTLRVGPACTLSSLYNFTLAKNKIIPGGSCGSVGIGGLTLGGGYGILSRQMGLTCDSLEEVTLVDAGGPLRHSAREKDLLWACRGGGNGNFGVISSMTFRVHTSPATLQRFQFKAFRTDLARANVLLREWFHFTDALPDPCFSAFVMNNNNINVLLTATGKIPSTVRRAMDDFAFLMDNHAASGEIPIGKALKAFYGIQHPTRFKNACAGLYHGFSDIESYIDEVLEIVLSAPPEMIFR